MQKIYKLTDHSVICFAGDIVTARALLGFIGKNITDRDNIVTLERKLHRWFKFKFKERAQSKKARPVEFLVAGTVTGRFSIQGLEFPETRVIRYRSPKFEPKQVTSLWDSITGYEIIGSGQRIREELDPIFLDLVNFSPLDLSNQLIALRETIESLVKTNKIRNVGGLFQIAFMNGSKVKFMAYTISSQNYPGGDINFSLQIIDGKFVQRDNETGKTIPLKRIWESLSSKDGKFGK